MIRKFITWLLKPAISEALKEHNTVRVNCKEVRIEHTNSKVDVSEISKIIEEKMLDIINSANSLKITEERNEWHKKAKENL